MGLNPLRTGDYRWNAGARNYELTDYNEGFFGGTLRTGPQIPARPLEKGLERSVVQGDTAGMTAIGYRVRNNMRCELLC